MAVIEGPLLPDAVRAHAPVRVVDVGANPLVSTPPYAALLAAGLAHVTGFEPQAEALARLHAAAGEHETYLPHAVGDGGRHVLRLCRESGFTSLLEPDRARLAQLVDFPRLAEVVATEEVDTVRLDDVPDLGGVDLLKLDLQGGELAVLRSGPRALERVLAVQLEMGFLELYEGQPSAADLDRELRGLGLLPLQVVEHRTWPLAPTQWAQPWESDSRQLVEADVLYVRDLARWDELTTRELGALALIADVAYANRGLARRCLRAVDARDGGALEAGYVARLQTAYA